MDIDTFLTTAVRAGAAGELPHLAGPAAAMRQVLAAHFVRDCPHIIEIGGHSWPITSYLTHRPLSVLSVDPRTEPFEAEELNGHPCRVRHVNRKFQELDFEYGPQSYGLVMLGYSLKPFGQREPLGAMLFSLIDNARTVVIEYSPALPRASSQVPRIVGRPGLSAVCSVDMELNDAAIAGSPYAKRRFHVLEALPVTR